VMGVLYALMQHDLKRLLAYHTVENIGIIFIGLGLALAFKAHGMAWAAALALTAGLLHVFNHSVFKSLLFFGAGAVLTSSGERDMEHLGGLIHRMPQTAFAFLVGCAAISALPPLNGFVSEWLTFQAILLSPQLPSWGLKLLVPAVGALLALSAALAAACFVKAFGVTFLGRARTPAAERARETDRLSLAAMFFFAALCLVAGIVPGFFIDALAPVVQGLVGDRCRCKEASIGSRSCRSPRAAAPITVSWSLFSWSYRARSRPGRSTGWPPTSCAARQRGTADIPRQIPQPSTPLRVSRSPSAGCSVPSCFMPASMSRCRRQAMGAQRGSRWNCMISFGTHSMLRSPSASVLPPTGSITSPSSPSGNSSAWSSPRSCSCCWCLRYGRDFRFRRSGRADAAGVAAGAVADRLHAQGEGAPLAPARTAAGAALSRPRAADAHGGGARGQCLVAVPGHSLSHFRRHLGGGIAGADLSHRPPVLLVRRSHCHRRAPRQRPLLPGAGRARCRYQLRRYRLESRGDDCLAGGTGDDHDHLHARADRRFDAALDHGGFPGFVAGGAAGLAGACAARLDHGGNRGERAHSSRQSGDPPRIDHGA